LAFILLLRHAAAPIHRPRNQRIHSAIGRSFAEFGLLRNEEA
jgi:hypothetical protein